MHMCTMLIKSVFSHLNSGDTLLIFFKSRFLRFKFSVQKEFHCSNKRINS